MQTNINISLYVGIVTKDLCNIIRMLKDVGKESWFYSIRGPLLQALRLMIHTFMFLRPCIVV